MQAHGGEHRQVHHRDARALQHQAITRVAQTQPPAQPEQGHGAGRDPGITHFHRYHHAFGGVTQQERQTEEQQQHADAQHGIAAEQPGPRQIDGALDGRGLAWRLWRRGTGGYRSLGHFRDNGFGTPVCFGRASLGRLGLGRGSVGQLEVEVPVQFGLHFDGLRRLRRQWWLGDWRHGFGRCCLSRARRSALLQFEQTLVERRGALFEARGKGLELIRQQAIALFQLLQLERLTDRQTDHGTKHGTDRRLVDHRTQHQPYQHEDPLHAVRSYSGKSGQVIQLR